MKKAIIHISDLHVSLHENYKQEPIRCKSILTTNSLDSNIDNFIHSFCNSIKNEFKDHIFYLIVTGDLTNQANIKEFEQLERILVSILSQLNIDKKDVLIIPGDHDVNRLDCENAFKKEVESGISDYNIKKSWEYSSEKFEKFKNFYDGFTGKSFLADSILVDEMIFDEEEIYLLGLNSNFKIDYEGGNGFFILDHLRKTLEEIEEKYKDYSKIACFHHNIFSNYENKMIGQWDDSGGNRLATLKLFEEFGVNCLFFGNEHTKCSAVSYNHSITYSDSGVLANDSKPTSSFKVYVIEKDENSTKLINNVFSLIDSGTSDVSFSFGDWISQITSKFKNEIAEIFLKKSINSSEFQNIDMTLSNDDFSESITVEEKIKDVKEIGIPKDYNLFSEENEDHKALLKLIKDNNLFHSGHFHWSKTSRAHNWIDISKLLANKTDLLEAKNFIINIIEQNNLSFDFIVGLGIEGNMLATKTSIVYNKDYTFLPYSYRYEDHSKYEKEFNFEYNEKYKTVLILTDVVHDGRTIRKLIHKEGRGKGFFEDVEKIIVIALFYTGSLLKEKRNDFDLLNKYDEDENFDRENDHPEKRIQFHFVSHIKVEECPYTKDNFETDCIIVREKLGCIHKFYSGN